MKRLMTLSFLVTLVALQAPALPALGQEDETSSEPITWRGQRVGVFSDVTIPANVTLHGDVVCIFGDAVVEGEVTGSTVVVGGTLQFSGRTRGQLVGVGSTIDIEEGSRIDGELVNIVGDLNNEGADVRGQIVNIPLGFRLPGVKSPLGIIGAIVFWATIGSLLVFFVAILILAALVPDRIRLLSEETPVSLLWAFLAGLGAYVVKEIVTFVLWISVIGFPLAILIELAFFVLKWLGMAGILHYLGFRLGRLANRDLSLLGALLLGFLPLALFHLVPFLVGGLTGLVLLIGVNVLVWLFIEAPGIGLVLLTKLGTRPRNRHGMAAAAASPPSPPAAQPPPAEPSQQAT